MFTVYRQDVYIGFTGCLALRTRNGRLKNSFNPGGTLPTHPVGPKKWTCIDMRGLLKWPNIRFCYLLYITFWFTLHLGDTRQELPRVTLHLEEENKFPAACICWAAALCVSEHAQKAWRDLVILEIIVLLSSN